MSFTSIQAAPPDAILGLTDAFKKDTRPGKVNLGVGVYQNEQGVTATLKAVLQAEAKLLQQGLSKSYMPITGHPEYTASVQSLLLGTHPVISEGRAMTAHTPGGTGGLRVGADFIKQQLSDATIWVSTPTWANHKAVFASAGVSVGEYPYYDPEKRDCNIDAMMDQLNQVPAGDVVLLHVCCHNPTGVDLSPEAWGQVIACAQEKGWIPFLDFAYQGFGSGLEEDRQPVLKMADAGVPFLISSSYSKNFGLYCERTGAFTLVAGSSKTAETAFSQVKRAIRANYSNPPAHGGHIVRTILSDEGLKSLWIEELTAMRTRIHSVRNELVDGLTSRGIEQDFSFIKDQMGMFSFSGLSDEQVASLKDDYSIYIVKGGRINVAGLTPKNIDYVCDSIAAAL